MSQTAALPQAEPAFERAKINFSWLLKLRWAGGVGQLITVLFVQFVMQIELPLLPLLTIIAIQFTTNFLLHVGLSQHRETAWGQRWLQGDWLLGSIVVFDIVLLSGLLYFTGGPSNPFSIFYLVNIALSGVLLKARWAWLVSGLAVVCYTLLGWFHHPLPALGEIMVPPVATVEPDSDWARERVLFSRGLFVALATSAGFIVYFILRLTTELAHRERELSQAQRRKAEGEKLEALATLAAGAAHELASPLSTIAVVAKELEVHLRKSEADPLAVEDAQLIRTEVARCREILDQMASNAGEATGEAMRWVTPAELIDATLNGLKAERDVEVEIDSTARDVRLFAPQHALAQALRGLVKNALDASDSDQPVQISARCQQQILHLELTDRGVGMSPEILNRVGNPFFTTKEPGKGMGLGIFLARKVIERQGGSLEFSSLPHRGTTVTITLPDVEPLPKSEEE